MQRGVSCDIVMRLSYASGFSNDKNNWAHTNDLESKIAKHETMDRDKKDPGCSLLRIRSSPRYIFGCKY